MATFLRPIAMIIELLILTAIIFSIFAGVQFTVFDLGLNEKYRKFIRTMLLIFGCMALVFFVAHLITFYPRLSVTPIY